VVEVVSANDSFGALIDKVGLYLRDGVRLVWVIDPQARRVVVYTPDSTMRVLTESDTLTGGAVLPEFSAPLSELLGAPEPPTA
jgi:Uma2 family endonuclease